MTVIEFDTDKGIYTFQLKALETEFHSHPVIEILFVDGGELQLATESSLYSNSTFAIIDANVEHRISGTAEKITVVMIEHRDVAVKSYFAQQGIQFTQGVYASGAVNHPGHSFEVIYPGLSNIDEQLSYDERVTKIIQYLRENDVEYEQMMHTFTGIVHLSESRLSHLFKQNIGVSLKKYVVWCKLRAAISHYLDKGEDLFRTLIASGFYDHPHFSKAFKTMFGVKPSQAYNSRTVQF